MPLMIRWRWARAAQGRAGCRSPGPPRRGSRRQRPCRRRRRPRLSVMAWSRPSSVSSQLQASPAARRARPRHLDGLAGLVQVIDRGALGRAASSSWRTRRRPGRISLGWRTKVPRPLIVSTKPSARSSASASRSSGLLTPNWAAILASVGSCWPTASRPAVISRRTSATSFSTSAAFLIGNSITRSAPSSLGQALAGQCATCRGPDRRHRAQLCLNSRDAAAG